MFPHMLPGAFPPSLLAFSTNFLRRSICGRSEKQGAAFKAVAPRIALETSVGAGKTERLG